MFRPIFSPHVVKRAELGALRGAMMRGLAVLLALTTGGAFIAMLGVSPFAVYATMIKGALGSVISLRETVKIAIPLTIVAIGVTFAFRMRFWNIGGEGQVCVGAIAATYFALFHHDWPQPVLIIVMALAGAAAGALYGLIPAHFKSRYGTNETLLTLMLNYVAAFMIQYLREGPWKNPKDMGFPKIAMFEKNARLPLVAGVHFGWIAALALVVLAYFYFRQAKDGYELQVVGENEMTARYAGMNVRRIILRTMAISAGICGLAGMLQATGADKTLSDTVAGGVGFTAIIVAWLSRLNPFGILIVASLFAVLEKGSGTVQSLHNISASAADVLQGIILFFVLGSEFFLQYRLVLRGEVRPG